MRKKILLYISFIIIIVLSGFIWPLIHLPYENTGIIGEYSKNNYNHNNDLIRYLVFVSIPIFTLLGFFIIKKQLSIKNFFEKINQNTNHNVPSNSNLIYVFFIFLIFLLLEFLSINFPIHKIDSFHEGQKMSSAFKYTLDNSLWSGSYVTVGIIYETIASSFVWNFFDNISVGSIRFFKLLLIFILKILLVIFSFQITKATNLKGTLESLYFIIISFISVNFVNYLFEGGQLIYREIPVLLTLIIFFNFILDKRKQRYLILLFGPISCISIFYSLDRGLVTNIFIIIFLIYLILNKDLKFFSLCAISIVLSWLFSFYYLGNEFKYFIENSISTINEIKQIGGIIHPIPFSGEQNSARSFKSLFLISLSLLISINLMNKKETIFTNKFILILFIISILCFLTYGYAIGRADGPHIRSTFGYVIIFYSSLIIYLLFKFFEGKNLLLNIKFNNSSLLISLVLIIFLFIQSITLSNIYSFSSRLKNYINFKDDLFLNDKEKNFVKNAKKILNNQKCIQIFTNDVLMLYLLRKPNCTEYYFPITIGSEKNQRELIKKLKNVKVILMDNDYSEFSPNYKLPLLKQYINKNYEVFYKQDKWLLMQSVK